MFEIQLHKVRNVEMCWDILRGIRWSSGVKCRVVVLYQCLSTVKIKKNLAVSTIIAKTVGSIFDDLTDTIFQ